MRRLGLAALISAILLGPVPSAAQVGAGGPPQIAAFVAGNALGQATLSPSGRYLAIVQRSDDQSIVVVKDLETGDQHPVLGGTAREHFGGSYIEWLRWKTDDRLIFGVHVFEVSRVAGREDGRVRSFTAGDTVISMPRDGSSMVFLRGPRANAGQTGDLLDLLPEDDEHLLLTFRHGSGLDVARVNVLTGKAERIIDGDRRTLDYLVDRTGAVMGRLSYRGAVGRILVMETLEADGRWAEVFRIHRDQVREFDDYRFLGPTDQPHEVYVAAPPQPGETEQTSAVRVFDFRTRTLGAPRFRHPIYDVSGVVLDAETRELVAGCYWADSYHCDFTDPQQNAVMNGIRRFLGEGWSVSVVSKARDGSRWLVHGSAPNHPGAYYLYDSERRHMDFVGDVRRDLPEDSLGPMTRIDYQARDGHALFGYLTRPPGAAAAARAPLVVLPHGGPESRDYLAYDAWAQFLATRGYQVFQPNFRGSSGMGKAFAEAGYGQWGRVMQDDITAGVDHLIAQGVVDRDQICIMGASYGGYAALWGGASQPDLYRCVISIAGLGDLVDIMRWERAEAGVDSDRYDYWVQSIGDPRVDRDRLEATSPIRYGADWRAPTLLIHGEQDSIVPISQSRDMARTLRRHNKDVRLVELARGGHSGWSTADHTTVLAEVESFLARHLPAARSTLADAYGEAGR